MPEEGNFWIWWKCVCKSSSGKGGNCKNKELFVFARYLMIIYMIFALLIIACWLSDHYAKVEIRYGMTIGNGKKFNFFFFIACLIACVFLGIRYDVGWDYRGYYDTIVGNRVTNAITNGEYINILLIRLVQRVNAPGVYFLLHAIIQLACVQSKIAKYKNKKWIGLCLYMFFPLFYINSFSVVRFFTALMIVFWAYDYIIKRDITKYIISVIIASMFHKTALVCVVFYFLYRTRFNAKKMFKLLVFSLMGLKVLLVFVEKLAPAYLIYLSAKGNREGFWWIVFFWMVEVAVIIWLGNGTGGDRYLNLQCNIYFVGLSIYTLLFQYGVIGHRLSLYGTIHAVLLVPQIAEKTKKKNLIIFFLTGFLILLFLVYVYRGRETYIPYQTIFSL